MFALKRLVAILPTFILVSIIVFGLTRLLPGDPARLILGEAATADTVAALREEMGLNRPLAVQYTSWLLGALRFDFGLSNSGLSTGKLIAQKLPITLELTVIAVLIAVGLAFVAGVLSALYPDTLIDRAVTLLSTSGICLPTFFSGILLIYAFSIKLRWIPSSGYVSLAEDPVQNLRLMVLPGITLGLYSAAVLTRYLRTSLLEVFAEDYVRTGRSKGVTKRRLLFNHVLRNAAIPVVTVLGLQLGLLIGGAIITEQVFSIPGIGNLLVFAVFNRDLSVVQGIAMTTAAAVFLINFVVDIAYGLIDPRIRLA